MARRLLTRRSALNCLVSSCTPSLKHLPWLINASPPPCTFCIPRNFHRSLAFVGFLLPPLFYVPSRRAPASGKLLIQVPCLCPLLKHGQVQPSCFRCRVFCACISSTINRVIQVRFNSPNEQLLIYGAVRSFTIVQFILGHAWLNL